MDPTQISQMPLAELIRDLDMLGLEARKRAGKMADERQARELAAAIIRWHGRRKLPLTIAQNFFANMGDRVIAYKFSNSQAELLRCAIRNLSSDEMKQHPQLSSGPMSTTELLRRARQAEQDEMALFVHVEQGVTFCGAFRSSGDLTACLQAFSLMAKYK